MRRDGVCTFENLGGLTGGGELTERNFFRIMATITTATEYPCDADYKYIATADGGGATVARSAEDGTWVDVATFVDGEQEFFAVNSMSGTVRVTPTGATVDFKLRRMHREI